MSSIDPFCIEATTARYKIHFLNLYRQDCDSVTKQTGIIIDNVIQEYLTINHKYLVEYWYLLETCIIEYMINAKILDPLIQENDFDWFDGMDDEEYWISQSIKFYRILKQLYY
jgi:hypothetical protein